MPPAGKKRTRPRLTLKVVVPIVMLALALAKPDFSSAQSQARLRGLFLASVTLYNLAAWVLKRRITGKRDGRTVRVVSEGKSELQSVCAYDTLALEKLYTESLIAYGFAFLLFNYWKTTTPLILQALFQPLQLLESPVVQVHMFGANDSEEPYERPWQAAGFFSALSDVQADLAAKQKAMEARALRARNGMKTSKKLSGKKA